MKKLPFKVIGSIALMMAASESFAANWLALQGTEPASSSARARVWGFIQPEYQYIKGSELAAGPWKGQDAVFNQIGPDRDASSQFQLRRARLGVRGTGFPLDSGVNYFLLFEAGNNGITKPGGGTGSLKLTDASVTLNYIKGARIRLGQFKYPGSEEGLQAIHVFNYVNFTNASNNLMLERFLDEDGSRKGTANGLNGPVGAYRDVGIQVFDTFKVNNWEHSYAVMIGNGNGIARSDNNNDKDYYLYWSSELVYGGKKGRRQGWKMFAWYQDGTRTLNYVKGVAGKQDFDRTRWGFGTTYLKGKYRFAAEYFDAEGMIFNGSDGGAVPGSISNNGAAVSGLNVRPEDSGDGYYLDFGYKVIPKLELDIRYDRLNRATDVSAAERRFETWTIGAQYFFNKKARVIVNYEFRDAEAPGQSSNSGANKILGDMDDVFSMQVLAIF